MILTSCLEPGLDRGVGRVKQQSSVARPCAVHIYNLGHALYSNNEQLYGET